MKRCLFSIFFLLSVSCNLGSHGSSDADFQEIRSNFGSDFPVEPPLDYQSNAPSYVQLDNRIGAAIDDKKATLGRVLFYDKNLSFNNSIACASCHQQTAAFGDTSSRSIGLDGGLTGRQSMRLTNLRFSSEGKMFWDERAISLNDQVTQPIQDHIEMGFSGLQGQPGMNSLLAKLDSIPYYNELFSWAFGNKSASEASIAEALTDFVSSIESFDSKYDQGVQASGTINGPFPNFTTEENHGLELFLTPAQLNSSGIRTGGGIGCAGCHSPPEFSIGAGIHNNGVDHVAGDPSGFDTTNTKSPSLRDVLGSSGTPNTPMMHTGDFLEFTTIIEHYNEVIPDVNNTTMDPRLAKGPSVVKMELTTSEREDLESFVKTLTGSALYSDVRWSSPF